VLGENGAGKSTLIKVMTGIHAPDTGVVRVRGEDVTFKGPGDAQRAGVAAIYQEPAIFPRPQRRGEHLHEPPEPRCARPLARMYEDAEAILARIDVRIGGGLGLLNGALVAYARVPSIIVTLGTLAIFRTWLINHSDSRTITSDGLPDWVVDLPNSTLVSFGEWDVRAVGCAGCIGCMNCKGCVACIGCVGLTGAVGRIGERA
jgi:hypothetical protein